MKSLIYLLMPFYGSYIKNYFQLYLDSIGRNSDVLRVIWISDNDDIIKPFRKPSNFYYFNLSFNQLRERVSVILHNDFNINVDPSNLVKSPYKLCDFRPLYHVIFHDIIQKHYVRSTDFIGYGDYDLIYGNISNMIPNMNEYHFIGSYGHLIAYRNIPLLSSLYTALPVEKLIDTRSYALDEHEIIDIAKEILKENQYRWFPQERIMLNLVADLINIDGEIVLSGDWIDLNYPRPVTKFDYIIYEKSSGKLLAIYLNGIKREILYCHFHGGRQVTLHMLANIIFDYNANFYLKGNQYDSIDLYLY